MSVLASNSNYFQIGKNNLKSHTLLPECDTTKIILPRFYGRFHANRRDVGQCQTKASVVDWDLLPLEVVGQSLEKYV